MSWEQIGNALTATGVFQDSTGVGVTGLTVTVDVYNPARTKVVTDGAATEVGDGLYDYTLAAGSVGTEGLYRFVFKTAATTPSSRYSYSGFLVGLAGIEDLDAAISSRSTYAGGAVASVTAGVTVATNTDKTGYSLSAAAVQAIWDALTSALTTVGSIGKRLADNMDAAISSRNATAPDNTAIATILSRTDVATSTRNATAPDNTSIAAIKAKTDNLPSDPASTTTVNTRLATGSYTAPDNTSIAAIKAKTDNLPADPASNTQVHTRLAATAYIDPPLSDDIAEEVWTHTGRTLTTALTPDQVYQQVLNALDDLGYTGNRAALLDALTNLDAAVSTVAGLVWTTDPRTLSDPFPYVPSASVVAGAVWDHSPRTLTTLVATVIQSALTTAGALTLVSGVDYPDLAWAVTGLADLTEATVAFVYRFTNQSQEHPLGTATVLSAGSDPQRIGVVLTHAETTTMGVGGGHYALTITWADGTITRPITGLLAVKQLP